MRVSGVFNRDGGTLKTADVEALRSRAIEAFRANGHELAVEIVAGKDLMRALQVAASNGEFVLAAGGDGTVSAAAGVAFEKGIGIAALPAGTMNLFARSLGVPLGLEDAIDALADGVTDQVDIATANGRPFVHQFSVGIHPKLVRLREKLKYRSRPGKMLASARASLGVLFNPPLFFAELSTPGGTEQWQLCGISVSNNPLDEGHLPLADRLDRGVLGIYLVKPLTTGRTLELAFGLLRGKFKSLPEIVNRESKEALLRFPTIKQGALAVIDGELVTLPDRIELAIRPRALRVLVPRNATGTQGELARAAEAGTEI